MVCFSTDGYCWRGGPSSWVERSTTLLLAGGAGAAAAVTESHHVWSSKLINTPSLPGLHHSLSLILLPSLQDIRRSFVDYGAASAIAWLEVSVGPLLHHWVSAFWAVVPLLWWGCGISPLISTCGASRERHTGMIRIVTQDQKIVHDHHDVGQVLRSFLSIIW
jgi:hypothetical protein